MEEQRSTQQILKIKIYTYVYIYTNTLQIKKMQLQKKEKNAMLCYAMLMLCSCYLILGIEIIWKGDNTCIHYQFGQIFCVDQYATSIYY